MSKERPWAEDNSGTKPFCVSLWGSNPGENDDCSTGADFATLDEAKACRADLWAHFSADYFKKLPFILLDGPGVHEVTKNPDAPKRVKKDNMDDWRQEIANEAGMLGGIEAYNEAMGYD